MSIKIEDIAYVRFAAPDLSKMQSFLDDFGLVSEIQDDGCLYARGRDGVPFNHVTERGSPKFKALGLRAESVDDLKKLAASEDAPLEKLHTPGGGYVLRLTDPDGFLVEIVADQTRIAKTAPPKDPVKNSASKKSRKRTALRLQPGPSHVMRLGHCVLNVSDFRQSERWYKDRFGFITSDEIEVNGTEALGAFMRCDRGDQPTDHHTLFLAQLPGKPAFMHAAFEVANLDDLMLGHAYLKSRKRKSAWGVGRHILGSQIFDYWRDPWGHELEHWTDGDLFTAKDGSNTAPFAQLLAVQWGMENPMMSGRFAPSPKTIEFFISLGLKIKRVFKRNPKETR